MKCKNKGNGNSQKMQKLYFTFECLVEVQNSNFMQYFFFFYQKFSQRRLFQWQRFSVISRSCCYYRHSIHQYQTFVIQHIKMIVSALIVNDCVMSTLRRPKKGFWQSLVNVSIIVFNVLSINNWLLFILV